VTLSLSNSARANAWLSTQETAYALLALSRVAGDGEKSGCRSRTRELRKGGRHPVRSAANLHHR